LIVIVKKKGRKIIWDWLTCCDAANLSQEEMIKYDQLRMDRKLNKIYSACPTCEKICSKPEQWSYLRVNCGQGCGDFCWNCKCKWIGVGLSICSNKGCDKSEFNKILNDCKIKSLSSEDFIYSNTSMPSIRACPKCDTLIEHTQNCKHMQCVACKFYFCFICLGIKENEKWPCSKQGAYEQCSLAPKQTLK